MIEYDPLTAPLKRDLEPDEIPDYIWLVENLPSWSARVRYLYLERDIKDIKGVMQITQLKYRHVYRILADLKKAQVPNHMCPVCRNRGREKEGNAYSAIPRSSQRGQHYERDVDTGEDNEHEVVVQRSSKGHT